ncbi:MAG: ester cyclase [Candidatus Zixiibacteriota bacterium]|nr:MAG: ester cyclase [candidate division Zixibacteria bacterium]
MKNTEAKSNMLLALFIPVLLLAGILIQGCARKQTDDITALIAQVENEVWNKGNVDLLDEIYDSGCTLHVGSSMTMVGTQGLKQMITMFREEIPDRRFTIDEIFSVGNKVAERYTWQGTHTSTGKELKVSGCVIYHVTNGKIVEAWSFEDMLGFYQQLGLVPLQPPMGKGAESEE